jgi:tRNA uridine 5-carboxymethylaminomethyl modification enzyme
MFTSRAEYRLTMRADNADLRLTDKGYQIGCVSKERFEIYIERQQKVDDIIEKMKNFKKRTTDWQKEMDVTLIEYDIGAFKNSIEILSYPKSEFEKVIKISNLENEVTDDIKLTIESHCRYSGFAEKQEKDIEKLKKYENLKLPSDINYNIIPQLSIEEREKLSKYKPETISSASRIQGIRPPTLVLLMKFCKNMKKYNFQE